jgi:hypothetical protein
MEHLYSKWTWLVLIVTGGLCVALESLMGLDVLDVEGFPFGITLFFGFVFVQASLLRFFGREAEVDVFVFIPMSLRTVSLFGMALGLGVAAHQFWGLVVGVVVGVVAALVALALVFFFDIREHAPPKEIDTV